MTTATERAVRTQGHDTSASENQPVRLSVNLAPSVAHALKSTAARKGLSITEAIRHAVAVWKLVTDEQARGRKIMIMEGEGDDARFREIILV